MINEINPLAGSILGSIQQQQVLGIEKNRQLRRSKALENNVATEDEQLEHEVEGADAVSSIRDEQDQQAPKRELPKKPQDDKPHIDIRG